MRHTALNTFAVAALATLLLAACTVEPVETASHAAGDAASPSQADATSSPRATPTPTASETPAPTPTPYGAAVFDDPDSCVNDELGFRVAFPESWYYNTAYADFEACRFFHPEFFEVADDAEPQTAITFRTHEGLTVGVVAIYTIVLHEETTVDGRPAVRWEYHGLEGGPEGPEERFYNYTFFVTDDHSETGPSVTATLVAANHPSYETNKEVLDGMIETIQIPPESD